MKTRAQPSRCSRQTAISERSVRRIDSGEFAIKPTPKHHWRTRKDPLAEVWDRELIPLLEANPELSPATLLDYLDDNYPSRFGQTVQRTLQRRVKAWKAKHGPAKEVMFPELKGSI